MPDMHKTTSVSVAGWLAKLPAAGVAAKEVPRAACAVHVNTSSQTVQQRRVPMMNTCRFMPSLATTTCLETNKLIFDHTYPPAAVSTARKGYDASGCLAQEASPCPNGAVGAAWKVAGNWGTRAILTFNYYPTLKNTPQAELLLTRTGL